MFNHTINFVRLIRNNFPHAAQNTESRNWLRAFTKPFRFMYGEFVQLRDEYLYKIKFNGQAMYLQTVLNLKFDPLKWRIHVVDVSEEKTFLYRKTGSANYRPNYLYWKWDATKNYLAGQFAQANHYVYKALIPNMGVQPGTAAAQGIWALHTSRHLVLRKKKLDIDANVRYIVYISSGVVYNTIALISTLDYYRFRGLKYQIKTY